MVIWETKRKLWFETKEAEQDYDDLMMANIEYQDGNNSESEYYTPVFLRSKVEKVTQLNEKAKKDIDDLFKRDENMSIDDLVDKTLRPENRLNSMNYWREWVIQKNALRFPFYYLILRELPMRNFYARSVVMFMFFGEYYKNYGLPIPFRENFAGILNQDEYTNLHVSNYKNLNDVVTMNKVSNSNNQILNHTKWNSIQPGFLDNKKIDNMLNIGNIMAKEEEIFWDGTMNQPTLPLSDPYHKKAKTLYYM